MINGKFRKGLPPDKDYDSSTIPDLQKLTQQLSKATRQKKLFWDSLKEVDAQIRRYIHAHEIPEKEFNNLIEIFPENRKEFNKNEWEVGRQIPLKKLRHLLYICNMISKTTPHEEQLKRNQPTLSDVERKNIIEDLLETFGKEDFEEIREQLFEDQNEFYRRTVCLNCGLPIAGKRTKYCSTDCADAFRKREDQRKRRLKEKRALENNSEIERSEKIVKGPNPRPGEGGKKTNCLHYNKCLNKALTWENFNCAKCELK